ncbi:hypothetical protein FBY33_3817 [Arthrobacter sp. SLBN-112]|jgi:hypothetical protein|uniref:hypothetical protein n=1 Tax=Arthrobacter sp. SLBN-112 TaxID=2768452 RepID=UPI00114F1308|nr:hypothetical protein [Arthrobacter sp. SLBN-112]TQJ41699.1 hypothetical protein FBY33_3817 [Arthrobacter sp. SLBN-112]
MTQHVPFPAGVPVHPLDHWLSPELARVSPPDAPSRLRQLADAQGTLAAGWSGAIAGGPVLALAGAFFSVMSGNPPAALVLVPLGAVLMLLGIFGWKRVRSALPRTDKVLITRGPGSARGGIAMVSFLAAIIGAFIFPTLPSAAAKGGTTAVTLVGIYVLTLALLVACIIVPSTVMGRARQSFRLRVKTNPRLRRAVEEDLAVWRDPYGNAAYGPL